jgi:uncharacterized protein (TIGR02001 family)
MVTAVSAAAVELDGSAAVVSDYRFRGESLSNRQPVGEASLQAALPAGWFAGISGVTSALSRVPGTFARHPEVDVSAGWSKSFGLLTPSAGLIGTVYPGGSGGNNYEAFGSLAATLGPATLTGGVNYAPRQDNLRRDNLYVYLSPAAGIPGTPLTLRGSVGREAGARQGGGRAKLDYGVGLEARVARRLTVSVRWSANDLVATASNRRMARAGVMVGVGVSLP